MSGTSWWSRCCRVKPLSVILKESQSDADDVHVFKKQLSLVDLIGYGVGCTVGAGIYSLIGPGVAIAGPALLLSFVIGAISCVLTGLAYSEFASRVPVAGSAYTYAYASFGELLAWILGWNLTLEYAISGAAIARSWGDYFFRFLQLCGLQLPLWLNAVELGHGIVASPTACAVVLACTGIMLGGIKSSSRFNVVVTTLNLAVLSFVAIVGSTTVRPSNWTVVGGTFVPMGPSSVFAAAATVFFSYLGYDMVSSLAEETRNPQRDLPLGIMSTLAIAAAVYVVVTLVVTGMVPYTILVGVSAPVSVAFEGVGYHWASYVVSAGSLFGLTTATFTCLLGQPRIFYRMATDGLLFPLFADLSQQGVPVVGTLLTGVVTATIALLTTLEDLANAISGGTLLAFCVVDAGVVFLRLSTPTEKAPPAYPTDQSVSPPLRSNSRHLLLHLLFFSTCSFLAGLSFQLHYPHALTFLLLSLSLASVVGIHLLFPSVDANVPSTFRCPLVPYVPCAGVCINLFMMAGLDTSAWARLGVWSAVGLLIYVLYGQHHSSMNSPRGLLGDESEGLLHRQSTLYGSKN